jgi:hypothetical protein
MVLFTGNPSHAEGYIGELWSDAGHRQKLEALSEKITNIIKVLVYGLRCRASAQQARSPEFILQYCEKKYKKTEIIFYPVRS